MCDDSSGVGKVKPFDDTMRFDRLRSNVVVMRIR